MDLKTMPPDARIWVYQSEEELRPELAVRMILYAENFLNEWSSHGSPMKAGVEVRFNRFLVIAADEETASAGGCSLDMLFRFIQSLEKEFGVSLLNRMLVAWEQEGKVYSSSLKKFDALLDEGKINGKTIVFNNLVETKSQLDSGWRIPLEQSWHAKLIRSVK